MDLQDACQTSNKLEKTSCVKDKNRHSQYLFSGRLAFKYLFLSMRTSKLNGENASEVFTDVFTDPFIPPSSGLSIGPTPTLHARGIHFLLPIASHKLLRQWALLCVSPPKIGVRGAAPSAEASSSYSSRCILPPPKPRK